MACYRTYFASKLKIMEKTRFEIGILGSIFILYNHCRFLVPDNTQKILRRFDTIFGLKMMVKSGLEKIIKRWSEAESFPYL